MVIWCVGGRWRKDAAALPDCFCGVEESGCDAVGGDEREEQSSGVSSRKRRGPCLLARKFCKNFHILHHIESLNAYIEY